MGCRLRIFLTQEEKATLDQLRKAAKRRLTVDSVNFCSNKLALYFKTSAIFIRPFFPNYSISKNIDSTKCDRLYQRVLNILRNYLIFMILCSYTNA